VPVRVNRYLASTGLGSRRAVEELIRESRVTVNGQVADLATRVNDGDDVRVDGEPVRPEAVVAVILTTRRAARP
jgi:16S rRNA U516 pseudouridylate synthase RsuA-like enzyme